MATGREPALLKCLDTPRNVRSIARLLASRLITATDGLGPVIKFARAVQQPPLVRERDELIKCFFIDLAKFGPILMTRREEFHESLFGQVPEGRDFALRQGADLLELSYGSFTSINQTRPFRV